MTDGLTQRYDPDLGLAEPAIRLTPEQARAGKEVGQQHGIPAPAAALIPDVTDLAEKARRKSMLSGSPLTQRWTADPINGALAQGDEENLSALEKAGNALWKGVLRTGAGAQVLGADLAAQRKADIGKTIEQIAREINPEFDQLSGGVQANILMAARERWTRAGAGEAPEGFAEAMDATARDYTTSASGLMQDAGALEGFEASERMAQALEPAREVDGTFSQILSALSIMAENPLDAAVFLGQTALESAAPTIAGAAATAITRSPAIGIGVMGAGSATAETSGVVQEFLGERGIDLTTPEGIDAALADPGLFQEAVDRGLAKGLVVALVDAASGGVAGKALARSPVGDMVAQAGVQAFSGALGEGLGSLAAGLEVSGVDLLLEAFAELVTTPVEVFGVAGRTLGDMRTRARGAGQTERALQEIGAIAEQSQLRERDPGAFRDFLEQAGHGDALIGLPAQEVDTFFQAAADGTPLELLEVTPEAYQEALVSGGDIYVPSAVFAERFAGTDAAELFHRHGTLNDGEMSAADAEAFNIAWREEVERAAESYQSEASERLDTLESDIQVRDQIFTQLRAAGQSAEVADRNATVWQSLFRTLGERYGEDALDLLRQFGIRIEGPQTPQSRRISQIDTMLETLRRTGAPKERSAGTSLVQSLVDRGGVRGLDIADAPGGLVLEDGPDLLGDTAGVDIDGAAQQALEDGFFPEHQWMLDQSATVTDADAAALRDTFVSAVETELQGQPVTRTISDVSPDVLALEAALRDLAAELDRLGVDLAEVSNDQIVKALQEGETLFQVAPPVDSAAFNEWAGDGFTMVEADDVNEFDFSGPGPFVLRAFHGTTHHFEAFNASIHGTKQGHFGAVNYFSTSEADASDNYAGEGPDLTGRIESAAERIVDDIQDVIDADGIDAAREAWSITDAEWSEDTMDVARNIARRTLSGGARVTVDAFIRTERPFVVGDKSPFHEFRDMEALENEAIERVAGNEGVTEDSIRENIEDYLDQIDEARWDIESEQPSKLFEAIDRVATRNEIDAQELFSSVAEFDLEGARHSEIEDALRSSEALLYADDPETGEMVRGHVLAEIVKELGFDAIILKDAASRFGNMNIDPGTAHIHVFDENKSNIKSVENVGTFDRNDPRILYQGDESPRGSISFPAEGAANGETVVRLFESADLSTFAHESAHFFLEVTRDLAEREDAPQEMKDDLAAIYRFIGHESGSLSTESHETFARAWEAYMMEGKAPSLALADVFARMKAWLTNIYRSLAGLNVSLTAEIREVFDRMLATDEEIAAARDMLGMEALFPDPQSAGMTEAEFAPYRRMAARAAQQAEQALMERTLAKIRRERKAWYKDERAALRDEIASTIYTRPEQRLIDMIANRKWYGEDDRETPDFRIDRAALIERFGEGILAQIGRDKFGGKRAIYTGRGEAGASPDEVAEYFGFESADAMVDALLNAGKTEALIDAKVDREMASRYGDPLNDGTIEDEALRAVHSEQQAKTVAAEARQLAKRAGKDARGITSRIFRQRARVMLGKMPVREAMRPARFLEAERRAARSASKEFAKVASGRGDSVESLSSAHRFKEQQLLNQYLYMEARDLEKRVNSGRERMRGFEKASVRKSIPTEYLEQIDALLDQHEFRKISQKEVDRREGLRAYVEQMKAEGREAELNIDDRILERAGRTHYTRLTADEFQGLLDTIDNIAHMGRFKGKLLDAKAERDLSAIVDEIGAEAAANLSGNPPGRGSATRGERARDTFRAALSWTLNPDTYLREIDGFKDLGPAYRHIKEPIDKAMGRLVERRQQMAKDFDQLYSTYSLKEQRAMVAKKAIPDAGVSLSKWDSLAVALNTGNEDNYARLVSGGEGSFTTGQVEAILATLDRRDWEFVQSMWDYIGGFWPEIEAKEKRQTGTAPKKVQARPMVPAYSFLKGGYYPLKYDGRLSGLASDFDSKALADDIMGGRFGKAQTKNGHTKERVNGVKQPVVLDMAVAHSHVQQVVHDIELSEALSASYKILQRLRPYYQNSSRLPDFEALELWLQDTAAGEQVAAHGMQKYIRHVRSGFTVSRLALNIGTVLIQPSGLSQSFVQVGKKAMARGVVDYVAHRERWVKTALDASPFMRERVQTFERDIYNVVGDATSGPVSGRWEKFQRDYMLPASFWLMQKVQFHTVDMPTWVGAYQDEMRRTSDPGRAVTHADQMVRRSQGSGLMSDRGMMERGTMSRTSRQQELPRLFTALGSYMFAKFNVAYEKTAGTDFRQPREVASLAADFVLLFTFEALLYQAVKGGLPDDDEDEGWAKWAASETALSMLSTFPFAREFAGALSGFGGGGITGGFTETFARPFIQASQGEWDQAAAKAGWGAIGTLFHLPVSQINYAIGAFFDEDMAFKRNPSLAEAVLGPSR